jgi:TMEM175 potassium channel family protein
VTKGRLEAFSDGVIAIIITIMVLELRVPHEDTIDALVPLAPIFSSYVLSFVHVGIYWNNHHHLLHGARHVTGAVLWCNLHLLFWLSLVPFVTGWMGENHFAPLPVALYGGVMLMSGVAYYLLSRTLVRHHGENSPLAQALGSDFKGRISLLIYLFAIVLAAFNRWISLSMYIGVAAMWLVPDRRMERAVTHNE